jgi:hypothetical protein
VNIEELTKDAFSEHLNTTFVGKIGEETLDLELVEVSPVRKYEGQARDPFSLLFRGPSDRVLAQGTYALDHGKMGELALFLVPVGPGKDGDMRYESIFN